METFNIICKKEALSGRGKKLLAFTNGRTYSCTHYYSKESGYSYDVIDDNNLTEVFFDLDAMFKRV